MDLGIMIPNQQHIVLGKQV